MAYKTRVPVRGAIILNLAMDKCLLVKGWKKGASWSFPRGKINKDEDDLVCAIREVREETGFDCEGFAKKEHFVDMTMRDQNLKLFIVPGIPEDTVFECQTRKEISVSNLPPFVVCCGCDCLLIQNRTSNGTNSPTSPLTTRTKASPRMKSALANTTWSPRSLEACANGFQLKAKNFSMSSASKNSNQ